MPDLAIPALMMALEKRSVHIRIGAARAFSQMTDARAERVLLDAPTENKIDIIAGAYSYYIRRIDLHIDELLIKALFNHGDIFMAEEYSNSDNNRLREAAIEWKKKHL